MARGGEARIVVANRAQLSWDLINPDGWLAPDHRARLVVGFVETLDLTVLYDKIEAREGTAGRPAADPAVLFALWLLATMDGVGSGARTGPVDQPGSGLSLGRVRCAGQLPRACGLPRGACRCARRSAHQNAGSVHGGGTV